MRTGPGGARATVDPGYDATGRVVRLHADLGTADGRALAADVTFDWGAAIAADRFRLDPPAGATEVPFEQLLTGVALQAAGRLGGLVRAFSALR